MPTSTFQELPSVEVSRVARIPHAVQVAAARGGGQDRALVFELEDGVVVALADGAGGTGNGAVAAQAIVDAVGAVHERNTRLVVSGARAPSSELIAA